MNKKSKSAATSFIRVRPEVAKEIKKIAKQHTVGENVMTANDVVEILLANLYAKK